MKQFIFGASGSIKQPHLLKGPNTVQKKVILQIGHDITIPSNGIITVMKIIFYSEYLNSKFDLKTVFINFPTLSITKKIIGTLKSLPNYLKVISKVDIVHIHHATGLNFYITSFFTFLSKIFRKKVILHNHGADFREFYKNQNYIQKKLTRMTFEFSDIVITLSQSWSDWHYQNISKDANWVILQNPSPLSQPKEPNDISRDDVCVLYMSRLEKRKGVYDLIDTIYAVTEKLQKVRFVFAGDGDIEDIQSTIDKMDLNKSVKLLGWVEKNRKIDSIKNADIFVLPSYNEGLPMALLECMSYGVACIASDVGGIPELIQNQQNGIIVKAGDRRQLENAIISLVSDKEYRCKIGLAAYKTIKESYSVKRYISRLSDLFLESVKT